MLIKQTDNLDVYSNCHDAEGNHLNVADQVITVVNNYNDKALTAFLSNSKLWLFSTNCRTKTSVDIPLNGERHLDFIDSEFIVHVSDGLLKYDIHLDKTKSPVKEIMEDFYKLPSTTLYEADLNEIHKDIDKMIETLENDSNQSANNDSKSWETEFAFYGPNSLKYKHHLKISYQLSDRWLTNRCLKFTYWVDGSDSNPIYNTIDIEFNKIQKYLPFDNAVLNAFFIDNKLYRIELDYRKETKFSDKATAIGSTQYKNTNSHMYQFVNSNDIGSVAGKYIDELVLNLDNGIQIRFCD